MDHNRGAAWESVADAWVLRLRRYLYESFVHSARGGADTKHQCMYANMRRR